MTEPAVSEGERGRDEIGREGAVDGQRDPDDKAGQREQSTTQEEPVGDEKTFGHQINLVFAAQMTTRKEFFWRDLRDFLRQPLRFMPLLPSFHFSTIGWLAVTGGAFAIGLNKGGLTGLGILPVLIFAVVFNARESTGFILPLLIVGDICAIITYRRVVFWNIFWRLLPPTLTGVVIGFLLMGRIPAEVFGPMIGWLIIALIALQLVRGAMGEKFDHVFESYGFGLFMGVLAGITTMIANAAGPVTTLYFLSVKLPKWNLIGTSSFLFFVINLCKVPLSAYLGADECAVAELRRNAGAAGGGGIFWRTRADGSDAAEIV